MTCPIPKHEPFQKDILDAHAGHLWEQEISSHLRDSVVSHPVFQSLEDVPDKEQLIQDIRLSFFYVLSQEDLTRLQKIADPDIAQTLLINGIYMPSGKPQDTSLIPVMRKHNASFGPRLLAGKIIKWVQGAKNTNF